MRNKERRTPITGAVTPYKEMTVASGSARSGNVKPSWSAQRAWLSTSWGEMASTTVSACSNVARSSRYERS
jgi:hypothetical protein